MRTPDEILSMLAERKSGQGSVQTRMAQIRDTYNGDLVIPLPEIDKNEQPAIANLAQVGIDAIGMRVASTFPILTFPPMRPGFKNSEERARLQRDVATGWLDRNKVPTLKQRRRARWLAAYSCAPVVIRPDADGLPKWYTRDPLGTYPAPEADPDEIVPDDVIFTYRRGGKSLMRDYPAHMARLRKGSLDQFDLVEYISPEQITCIIVGADSRDPYSSYSSGENYVVLHDLLNRTDHPLCIAPGRVTLDKPLGQFDGVVGMYQLQGRLMALHVQAVQRGVFPETWAVSTQAGQPPEIHTVADGLTGRIGRVTGQIVNSNINPGVYTPSTLDRIEYAERHEGGVPAEFGGSAASNIRTGQRGAQVLSETVDFRVQELQQILELSLQEEIYTAVRILKAYTSSTFSMYVEGRGKVSYDESTFDDDTICTVKYAYAGADANNLVITGGQRVGLETMSRRTFMEMDPAIHDVEIESDRIKAEQLDRAFWQSMLAKSQDPNSEFTAVDYARLHQLIITDKMDQYDAVQAVNEEIKQRQAQMQQGQLDMTQMQPGLAPAGAPGTPQASVAPPEEGIGNVASTLGKLRLAQMQLASERAG